MFRADELFIMGVGNAYLGAKVLLINRGKSSPFIYHY